jgi:hypothetical protein
VGADWQYQLRLYLPEEVAGVARADRGAPVLRPLAEVLDAHGAALVNQLDAFEAYVAEAEREGPDRYPLYRWTKATVEDPAKRRKHMKAFALHVAGREVSRRRRRTRSRPRCDPSWAAASSSACPGTAPIRPTTWRYRPNTARSPARPRPGP